MCENTIFPARDTTDTLQSKEKSNNLDTDKIATCTSKDVSIICMLMQYTASVWSKTSTAVSWAKMRETWRKYMWEKRHHL